MENGNYGTANYRNPIKMCDWNHFFVHLFGTFRKDSMEYASVLRNSLLGTAIYSGVDGKSVWLQLNATMWSKTLLCHSVHRGLSENSFVELVLSRTQCHLLHRLPVHFDAVSLFSAQKQHSQFTHTQAKGIINHIHKDNGNSFANRLNSFKKQNLISLKHLCAHLVGNESFGCSFACTI